MGIYIDHPNKQEWCIAHGTPINALNWATVEEARKIWHDSVIKDKKMIVCLLDKQAYKAVLICWYPKELYRTLNDPSVLGYYGVSFEEVDKLAATTCEDMIAEAKELGWVGQ